MAKKLLDMMSTMNDEQIADGMKKAEGMLSEKEMAQLKEFIKMNRPNTNQ